MPLLAARGIHVECATLPTSQRAQFKLLGTATEFDGIWWHRHLLSPWWLGRLRKSAKRLVFDFDDPLIYTASGGGRPSFSRRMRFRWMLKRCDAAFAASNLLADMARPMCKSTHVVPMAIDLPGKALAEWRWRHGKSMGRPIELLWLGSLATQPYLELIRGALVRLGTRAKERLGNVKLRLVAHEPMKFGALEVDFRKWSHEEQEKALSECDVGLCPMPDTVWTRGKCPFKVLQYMAYGMPWVGSAVGENIVTSGEGERGLCATATSDAWLIAIELLLADEGKRESMGRKGRAYVEATHDRAALVKRIESLWRGVT